MDSNHRMAEKGASDENTVGYSRAELMVAPFPAKHGGSVVVVGGEEVIKFSNDKHDSKNGIENKVHPAESKRPEAAVFDAETSPPPPTSRAMRNFDDVLDEIDSFGRFQKIAFVILSLNQFFFAFQMLAYVFIAAAPDHWCRVPELERRNVSTELLRNLSGQTETTSSCSMYALDYSGAAGGFVYNESGAADGEPERTTCLDGWTFDTSVYASTIVTEVTLKRKNHPP